MATTIVQTVLFENTTASELYSLYMDSEKHAEVTDAVALITEVEGEPFSAYDDYISGVNLKLIKDTLIVQSWRTSDWEEDEPDSTFMLYFETKGDDVTLHVVHSNIPDDDADNIDNGWHEFYWEPWKEMLE